MQAFMYENKFIDRTYIADTFFKRFLGYMFRRKPHHQAIIFKPCNSIHTLFMKFDIDVLFVNDNMEVIKIYKNVKPWSVIMPVKEATGVIEVPSIR